MVMPRSPYGMSWVTTVAFQISSALHPSAQLFASPRPGIRSQTMCTALHQHAWQKACSCGDLLPWIFPRAARLSCEDQFDGYNLKLEQVYSFYLCCCLGLAHEWGFIGQFKYETWSMGELHLLWPPGGRAQGITVHSMWQIVGGNKFVLRLQNRPIGCFGLRGMRTMSSLLAYSALGWSFPGAAFAMPLLGGGFL